MAQAGNVAVPGAAREHFPSSGPTTSSVSAAAAAASDLGKRKTSDLGRGYCSLDDGDGDDGVRRGVGDFKHDRATIGTSGGGGTVTNRNGPRSPAFATRRVSEGVTFSGTGKAGEDGGGGGGRGGVSATV